MANCGVSEKEVGWISISNVTILFISIHSKSKKVRGVSHKKSEEKCVHYRLSGLPGLSLFIRNVHKLKMLKCNS